MTANWRAWATDPPPNETWVLVALTRPQLSSRVHVAKFRSGLPWIVGTMMAHDLPGGTDQVVHWTECPEPPP